MKACKHHTRMRPSIATPLSYHSTAPHQANFVSLTLRDAKVGTIKYHFCRYRTPIRIGHQLDQSNTVMNHHSLRRSYSFNKRHSCCRLRASILTRMHPLPSCSSLYQETSFFRKQDPLKVISTFAACRQLESNLNSFSAKKCLFLQRRTERRRYHSQFSNQPSKYFLSCNASNQNIPQRQSLPNSNATT